VNTLSLCDGTPTLAETIIGQIMTMTLQKIVFITGLLISKNCVGQDKNEADVTNITKVTFFNPGISYERRIQKLQTLYAQVFMNTSGRIEYSSSFGNTSTFYFDPAFTLQYRYYYNAARRLANDKRIEMNSLNYLSSIYELVYSKRQISASNYIETNRRALNTFGIAWGFQRNYKRRFSIDLNLGAGYLFGKATLSDNTGQAITKNVGQFTPVGQLNIGLWLNRRE
jgi:hypothetical protein